MKSLKQALKIFLLIFILASCKNAGEESTETVVVEESAEDLLNASIKRGEYLTNIMDCHICHTPKTMTEQGPVPDLSRSFMGYPADDELPEFVDGVIAPDKWGAMTNHQFNAWAGPWGVSFAANLTPDETGTGTWTLEQFGRAIREGKFKGMENGRTLLPPMPWPTYSFLTDEDVKAIYDFLQSVPPIRNVVPAPIPPTEM